MKRLVVIILALAALMAFCVPAFAADAPGPSVVVGGRMLLDFGYQHKDRELTTSNNDVTTAFMNLAAHSYLNARFTSADKTSGGLIELGLSSKIDDNESVSLRYAYGWYKVGNCRFVAGQNDSWLGSLAYLPRQFLGLSQSAKLLMCGFGYVYSGRNPQARIEWTKDSWGVAFSLVQPGAEETTFSTAPTGTDLYATFPAAELAVQFRAGGFMTTPAVGWVQLKYEGTASGVDDNVTGWIATLPIKFTAGAFTVKGGAHYGSNTSINWNGEGLNVGALRAAGNTNPDAIPVWVNGKVEDTKVFGGYLTVEYRVGKALIAAGAGADQLSNDGWKKQGNKEDEYTRYGFFVNTTYDVTQNFSVLPEFSYWDYGDLVSNGKDGGNEWLLGVQFRFVF